MTEHELESFEKQLRTTLKATEATLKHLADDLNFGDDVDHGDEKADEAEEFANQVGVQQVLREKIESIEAALEKIRRGKYGVCESCGQPIDSQILHAVPESHLCRRCKQKAS
ncbi:MAG: hypothetical protein UY23_C0001G0192 [Candidatus Jorgensenbacteria bacterium GW2011_GWA1_48_11]|uniref:Zinc finger DksA/TraR C4-type domain-containing protein n=1 Tax=Candidatus Jorgensenbacteria bacterium GW2011_GWA1_48_11 TaxID=1618660 RepID=A0A0G1UBR5_9BACT|nr:MAG: hypothetical protein UY23_C0001G0192 [Candidatus Jorgensenbacteria bacterium GW2011_GWA1_48_11]KKW12079.1 MAG: hypothetical protein UY51_C0005G0321 [Candidatus Jorgensenbacteria bacterium GW2011_GWB1_49_9]